MKKTWVRKTLSVGVLAAGALLLAPAAVAQADTGQASVGNVGFLNGTQIAVPVTVPVNVVGNSAGVLGAARGAGVGANQVENGRMGGVSQASALNRGFANGTQVAVPVTVPVNVSGNAAAVAGAAQATGISANRVESTKVTENGIGSIGGFGDVSQATVGNVGWLNGTQLAVPVKVPVNACGNSLALIGGASSTGICANQIGDSAGPRAVHPLESAKKQGKKRTENATGFHPGGGISVGQASYLNNGWVNGTQAAAPITVPINACGNALSVLGHASATGICSNQVGGGGAHFHRPMPWVKPLVPVYPVHGYVVGGDDCGDQHHVSDCGTGHDGGVHGGVHGDGHGDGPGAVHNDGHGDKGDYGDGDVRDDKDGYDDGDVRGDHGGYDDKDDQVKGDHGQDDHDKDDHDKGDAGYDKGGNRGDDEEPDAADADEPHGSPAADEDKAPGYVSPDKYGNTKAGGRSAEKSPVSGLTQDLGGVGTAGFGGLDLLNTLR